MNKKVGLGVGLATGLALLAFGIKKKTEPPPGPPIKCAEDEVWVTGQGCVKKTTNIRWTLQVPQGVSVNPLQPDYVNNTSITLTCTKPVRWLKNGVALEYGKFLETVTFPILESVVIRIEEPAAAPQLWILRTRSPYMHISGPGVVVDPSTNYVTVPDNTPVKVWADAGVMAWRVNDVEVWRATQDNCGRWNLNNTLNWTVVKDTIFDYEKFDTNRYNYRPNYSYVYHDLRYPQPVGEGFEQDWTVFFDDWPGETFWGGGCPDTVCKFTAPASVAYWWINGVKSFPGQSQISVPLGTGLAIGYVPNTPVRMTVQVRDLSIAGYSSMPAFSGAIKVISTSRQYGDFGYYNVATIEGAWDTDVTITADYPIPVMTSNGMWPAWNIFGTVRGANDTKLCWRTSGSATCPKSVTIKMGQYSVILFR